MGWGIFLRKKNLGNYCALSHKFGLGWECNSVKMLRYTTIKMGLSERYAGMIRRRNRNRFFCDNVNYFIVLAPSTSYNQKHPL